MYRKKKNKKYFLLSLVIILGFILVYFVNSRKDYIKIEEFIKDIGISVQNLLIPKVEVDYNKLLTGINTELEEENNELKKMLDLKTDSYKFISASVLERNIDWYQEIIINKGKKDGVLKNMAVVANDTLIGKVVKTTNHSSTVKLLTSNVSDMKVAVDIKSGGETYHGILDGFSSDDNIFYINNVYKNSDIELYSKVYTNGLGGIYPSGIYIGRVIEIGYDSLGLNKILKIKADTSYDKLRYVTIIDKED